MTQMIPGMISIICVVLFLLRGAQKPIPLPVEKPRIVVYKSERMLEFYSDQALENEDFMELFDAVSVGTPVTIKQ